MKRSLFLKPLILLVLVLGSSLARADHHLWMINEVYSNADGTVQFIEFSTTVSGQGVLSGRTLTASDGGSVSNSLNFTGNLSGETANRTFLVATARFTSLTGLQPDFTIPAGFLPLRGGTVNFANGVSVLTYSAGQLPLNGVQSINSNRLPQDASPKNFAGLGASVAVEPRASFNPATGIMNVPVLDAPGIGIGNVSFSVNLTTLRFTLLDGFYLFGAGVTSGTNPARFQNGVLDIPAMVFGTDLYSFRLASIPDASVVFGNPVNISVIPVPADPVVAPPNPPASDLQQSIARGQTQYNQQCASCHGATGQGGSAPNLRTSSLNTFATLRSFTNDSMPQLSPGTCVDGGGSTCATDVANYIINSLQQSGSASRQEPEIGSVGY